MDAAQLLYETFSMIPPQFQPLRKHPIQSCKVATNYEKGSSKGLGLEQHYNTKQAADLVVHSMNVKLVKGKKLYVGKFILIEE